MMIYSKKNIIEALKKSEVKWANIYQGHSMVNDNCALCNMFLFLNDCQLCPIMSKTGFSNCQGTPFIEWCDHQRYAHGVDIGTGMIVRCKDCSKFAKRQLTFITELLKELKAKK